MAGDLVSPGQASGMGGADKPAGAKAENTFQNKNVKQLVVLVRYKPKPKPPDAFGDMSAAEGMIKSVTGAVESAVSSVEDAMASIPGLAMFIKEKKTDSPSQSDYSYDYADWDSKFKQAAPNLQQINPENKISRAFEFSSLDAAGRKQDASDLLTKVKGEISGWSKYTVWIHFAGIGDGAHVINECTALLGKDSQFMSEKWCVKSVIYVSAPLFRDQHVLNQDVLKGEGRIFSFASKLDLTRHAVDFFEPRDKLVQMIKDSNKNTMSLAVGKIKLRVIRIISLVLGGLNISSRNQDDLNKFGMIKSEVTGMVGDTVDLIKKIISDTASFVQLGKLPEFSKLMDGFADIPGQCVDRLQRFVDDFTKEAGNQLKSADVSLGPRDLAGALNCLCPLFDHVSASMSVFKYESKTGADLARQMIDSSGITAVYMPAASGEDDLSGLDPYYKKAVDKAVRDGTADPAYAYVAQAQQLIGKAAEKGSDIKTYTDEQTIALAEALFLLVRPMMVSKEQVYKQLLDLTSGFVDVDKLTENLTANKLMGIPGDQLKKLNIDYPPDLKNAINGTDQEMSRIRGFFNKNNFGLQEDSQYFIFNSHNLIIGKMPDAIAYCLDETTGFLEYQRSKGLDNEFPQTGKYKYNQAGSKPKENVLPAQALPVAS